MKRTRIMGLCLAAVLALGAIVAAVAQAEPPQFGRCVASAGGKFNDPSCTEELKAGGKFEWDPGAGPKSRFTTASKEGEFVFETVGKEKMSCSGESGTGSYAAVAEKVKEVILTLTGCTTKSFEATCSSSGSGEGKIVSKELEGALGIEADGEQAVENKLGLDLFPKNGSGAAMEFSCGGGSTVVDGSVIVPIASNTMEASTTLLYSATRGRQKPDKFVGEPMDVLEASTGGGALEQAGWTVTETLTNDEPMEASSYRGPLPPTVKGVSPDAGPASGGTAVTISGVGLYGATAVKFGDVEASEFKVISPTEITAESPSQTAGTVPVAVTTPSGTSASEVTPGDRFRYTEPPEYSVCAKAVKVDKKYTGQYTNSECTERSTNDEGKWELESWEYAKRKTFTAKGERITLPSYIGFDEAGAMECESATGTGEITGPKTSDMRLELVDCKLVGEDCASKGDGRIVEINVEGELGYLPGGEQPTVGLLSSPAKPGEALTEGSCGSISIKVEGSFFGVVAGDVNRIEKSAAVEFPHYGGGEPLFTHFEGEAALHEMLFEANGGDYETNVEGHLTLKGEKLEIET